MLLATGAAVVGEGGQVTVSRVTELLAGADTGWRTARGVCRHWRNQPLVAKAFQEECDRVGAVAFVATGGVGAQQAVTYSAERAGEADELLESVVALAVDRVGARRRGELVSWVGEELRTALVVIDGDTFWARRGSDVWTNGGDPNTSHGGAEMSELLQPSAVLDLFELASADVEDVVAGRPCLTVQAHRIGVPRGHTDAPDPFAMIFGGNDFRLSVDRDTGVLLRVVKVVDGQAAEVCEFLELDLDVDLPEALFAPLDPGAGQLIDTRTLRGPRRRSVPRRRLRDVVRRSPPVG